MIHVAFFTGLVTREKWYTYQFLLKSEHEPNMDKQNINKRLEMKCDSEFFFSHNEKLLEKVIKLT